MGEETSQPIDIEGTNCWEWESIRKRQAQGLPTMAYSSWQPGTMALGMPPAFGCLRRPREVAFCTDNAGYMGRGNSASHDGGPCQNRQELLKA